MGVAQSTGNPAASAHRPRMEGQPQRFNWHGEGRMETLHALCSAEERRIGPAAYGLLLTLGYLGAHRFYCRLAMNSLRGAPGA